MKAFLCTLCFLWIPLHATESLSGFLNRLLGPAYAVEKKQEASGETKQDAPKTEDAPKDND